MKSRIQKFITTAFCLVFGTVVALAWGEHTTIRTIQTQTMLIRHKATEAQRRAAEANAKVFFKQLAPEKRQELKKKKIKSVLIRTVRSKETSPQAKEVMMRYSLEGESLIDDYAYEFPNPLEPNTIAQVRGIDPEYIGQ